MRSLLGSALANIFVGYYEEKLFSQTQKPPISFRYVDDMFAIFDHEAKADKFLTKLNCFYLFLKFTLKKRKENVYCFVMSMSKKQMLALRPVYTGNPLSLASVYVGSP